MLGLSLINLAGFALGIALEGNANGQTHGEHGGATEASEQSVSRWSPYEIKHDFLP